MPLDDLPSFALAQIVCTYADTAASGTDRSVVLGGPAGEDGPESGEPLRRFECGTALRTRPEAGGHGGDAGLTSRGAGSPDVPV